MWVVVDVEADGPCPGLYSMVNFGAVVVEPALDRTFKGETAPISDRFDPKALAVSGVSRAQHQAFPPPEETIHRFAKWLFSLDAKRLVLVSDNPAFDAPWINYYFCLFGPCPNPFGHSARRIADMFAGMKMNASAGGEFKKLRRTAHDHDPVNDAKSNAEALLAMREMGLKLPEVPV